MKIHEHVSILDRVLEDWRPVLDADFTAYRNHCYRVLNFCLAFCGESADALAKVAIAAAFHDLGIWANGTYDYLGPLGDLPVSISRRRAKANGPRKSKP